MKVAGLLASARASEETGVQMGPVQARLDELSRRLERHDSLIRTFQATQIPFNEESPETAWWTTEATEPQRQPDDDACGKEMISGLAKAGAKAGTTGRMHREQHQANEKSHK